MPITYRQFQAFIDAPDGYSNPKWWQGLHEDGRKQQQGGPGNQWFDYWNHPRERVSWYDAIAFCAWLTEALIPDPSPEGEGSRMDAMMAPDS